MQLRQTISGARQSSFCAAAGHTLLAIGPVSPSIST
jgi:hypothetical protein